MYFREYLAQETTISVNDILLIVICSAIFALFRLLMNKLFLRPLSVFALPKMQKKFVNRGFDTIHYILSATIGTLAFLQQPYAHCPFYILDCREWLGQSGDIFTCSIFEKIYYVYFASYYFSDVFWLHTCSDIKMLIFHHIFTISLIVTCVIVCRPVYGLSIMLFHDWVDVFLYSGKIATYLGKKFAADICLVIFGILFFYLRIFGCSSIVYTLIKDSVNHPQTVHQNVFYFGCGLFLLLITCHIIWGIDIVKALIRVLKGEQIHDTRSDPGSPKVKPE